MMDALDLYARHECEQERRLSKRPICYNCQEHIQDERAYYANDVWICIDCLERDFMRDVEDYIE